MNSLWEIFRKRKTPIQQENHFIIIHFFEYIPSGKIIKFAIKLQIELFRDTIAEIIPFCSWSAIPFIDFLSPFRFDIGKQIKISWWRVRRTRWMVCCILARCLHDLFVHNSTAPKKQSSWFWILSCFPRSSKYIPWHSKCKHFREVFLVQSWEFFGTLLWCLGENTGAFIQLKATTRLNSILWHIYIAEETSQVTLQQSSFLVDFSTVRHFMWLSW